jgi:hypothetical protein
MKKKNELSGIEEGFEYLYSILDELEHDLDSGDPLTRGRASRIVTEKFRLEFNKEIDSYRVVLKGFGIPANKGGYETISTNCDIFEYLLLRNTMDSFNLVPTMENLKAIFDYSRKKGRALRILRNNPDANDEIKAYRLVKKALEVLVKIFNINNPEQAPIIWSTEDHEHFFKSIKQ